MHSRSSLYSWVQKRYERLFTNPLIRRVIKNSGYLFSATGISAAISMLQSILVGRLLGVAGFGLLGVIVMFTSVINNLVSFRMTELVVRYVNQYEESGDKQRAAAVFKAAALTEMLASLAAFLIIWLLSPWAADLLGKNSSLAGLFVLYGLIVVANLISESATGVLQIFDRYARMASFSIVQSLITLALITYVFITQGNIVGVLLAYIVGKTVGAVVLTAAAVVEAARHWGANWWKTPLSLLRPQARELTHFAVSTNLSGSLNLINKDSELLWVSLFRNPLEAGFYKTALALINLVQMPISPLPQTTYPELSRQVIRKNWRDVRHILRQGSWMAGGFTLAVGIVLVIFGRQLILLLYKDPGFLPAYPAMLILLAGFLVANIFYWNRIALLSLGLPHFPTQVNLILAILKIIGLILLVPKYGYLASAGLFSAYYIISTSLAAWKVRKTIAEREATLTTPTQPAVPGIDL
jgi:O-antigen/teichoic acid export membrane protein